MLSHHYTTKETLIILLVFVIFFLYLFPKLNIYPFKHSSKKRKHVRNIRTGDKIIHKLKNFSGAYKEAQALIYLKKINPYVFEELILSAYKNKGHVIIRNKSYSGDGGMDGAYYDQNKNLVLIQCKRYANHVKLNHIEDFHNLIVQKNAIHGHFIHTGKTPKTVFNKIPKNITVISGTKLINLIISNQRTTMPQRLAQQNKV